MPLALLRDELASADFLPPPYEKYRPLLADGICFFLERLPDVRVRRIFVEQSRMPASASMAERLVALLYHVPTLHKLGQVVARDRRLDANFRKWLQQLESLEPRTSAAAFTRLLDRDFSGWRKSGIELGPQALAEGSVAMVMPFAWRSTSEQQPREGVFKLLKPAIEDRLEEDLAIWGLLGDFLEEDCVRYHLPTLQYRETFELVRDLLRHEVRLEEEQKHLAEAADDFAGMNSVVIPQVFPFCTPRLTAMERLRGVTLSESLQKNDPSGRALAPVLAEALIARAMFSSCPTALFHADPHAGNLFVSTDGRLGILDWSLAGRLRKEDRVELVQLLMGALTLDAGRMQRAVEKLSWHSADPVALAEVLARGLQALRWGSRPGIAWVTGVLDEVVTQAGARLKSDLLLFRKSLLTLEGVLADLAGLEETVTEAFIDQALFTSLFQQLSIEWPQRFRQGVDSRAFQTHLSTDDLLSLLWSAPATCARYWTGAWQDLLGPV